MYQLKKIVLQSKSNKKLFVCDVEEGMFNLDYSVDLATNFKTVNKAVEWMQRYHENFIVAKALLPLTPKWEVTEL